MASDAKIPHEDVTVRESDHFETGGVLVVATARYARGVMVPREAIEDNGQAVVAMAREQATRLLLDEPLLIKTGEFVSYVQFTMEKPNAPTT